MTAFDLLGIRFLLASFACLAAGLGIWAMVVLCARFVPALFMQRSVWLLGEITVAATFLVVLLPHTEALRVVPTIEIGTFAQALDSVHKGAARPTIAAPASAPNADAAQASWLIYGARAWLLLYLLGLGHSVAKLLHGQRLLTRLARDGCRVANLDQHDGFAAPQTRAPTLTVIEVDAPISPMLLGPFQPRLILPRHLRSFDVVQQQMIVEHELTHLRRRDLHWMTAGFTLQVLFWFNPVMRRLRAHLAWAQELGCDRDVLRGRSQGHRKAYAAALVAQLKLQHRPVNMAVAFGAISASTLAARVSLIREPENATCGQWARWAAFGGLATVFVGNLSVQPVLEWNIDPSQARRGLLDQRLWPLAHPGAQAALRCTELIDAASGKHLVHEGACSTRITPASTFNIAVSLMGYDSGILRDEHAPALPFKPGYADWMPAWRAPSDPTDWIRNSTVWYAQQVASKLGAARFGYYVKSFDYGNHDVSGDPGKDNGLALSWISSSLQISPAEQVAFLRKVVNRELPLTAHAYDMTSRLLRLPSLPNGWEIYGKTGTASPVLPDGKEDQARSYGWFVGWATKGQRTVVFARLVLDKNQENSFAGARVKEGLLRDLPGQLNSL